MIPTSAQAKAEQIVLPSEETLTVPSFDCPLKYVVYPGIQLEPNQYTVDETTMARHPSGSPGLTMHRATASSCLAAETATKAAPQANMEAKANALTHAYVRKVRTCSYIRRRRDDVPGEAQSNQNRWG